MFVTVREDAFGEDYALKFCGRTYSEERQGKQRIVLMSDQINLCIEPRLGS